MSWLYSQALVEAFSEGSCSDGEPSAQLNWMPTLRPFSRNGKMIDCSSPSLFGLTCGRLTAGHGEALLMWFRAGFPVRTSASPAKAQESTARAADSGPNSLASSARYDRATRSWRTLQRSLLEDSAECSAILPSSGMTRDGLCWALPMLGRRIKGIGSGSARPTAAYALGMTLKPTHHVPTPTASDHIVRESTSTSRLNFETNKTVTLNRFVGMFPTPSATSYGSNRGGSAGRANQPERPSLQTMASRGQWPTPTATLGTKGGRVTPRKGRNGGTLIEAVAAAMWPTPTMKGNHNRKGLSPRSGDGLATVVGGQLSPDWTEWLMAWPIAWTDLKPLATGRFRQWLRAHGSC